MRSAPAKHASRAVGSDGEFLHRAEETTSTSLVRSRLAVAVVEGATRAQAADRTGQVPKLTFKSLEVVSQFLELTFRGMVPEYAHDLLRA